MNLRLLAATMSEDGWVQFLQDVHRAAADAVLHVHAMDETQMRSLYQYIATLKPVGTPAPDYVPPGGKPTSPYNVFRAAGDAVGGDIPAFALHAGGPRLSPG